MKSIVFLTDLPGAFLSREERERLQSVDYQESTEEEEERLKVEAFKQAIGTSRGKQRLLGSKENSVMHWSIPYWGQEEMEELFGTEPKDDVEAHCLALCLCSVFENDSKLDSGRVGSPRSRWSGASAASGASGGDASETAKYGSHATPIYPQQEEPSLREWSVDILVVIVERGE